MQAINKNSAGVAVGVFVAFVHLVWSIVVATNLAQVLVKWVMHLHFVDLPITFLPFNALMAVWLLVAVFVAGYIGGWVFSWVWNLFHK